MVVVQGIGQSTVISHLSQIKIGSELVFATEQTEVMNRYAAQSVLKTIQAIKIKKMKQNIQNRARLFKASLA